ncbi:hypothetical protein [Virgibacillus halodenitrificans]|uniref:hypothetical protein n=1 Tax=Virgibacillus halodenitrificans TaxID=1482 RepID=UPI001CB9B499|nr:hypothetical protein [Virgibacillus halodenitrificans]
MGRVIAVPAPERRDFSLPAPITHSGVSPMPHLPQKSPYFSFAKVYFLRQWKIIIKINVPYQLIGAEGDNLRTPRPVATIA